MECSDAELSILITNDEEIRELNRTYRDKDKPTDVLSFAQTDGVGPIGLILGDVVISLETAERQALEFSSTLTEELSRLLIHGTLHLLGYDHENVSRREAERMVKKEQELYRELVG